MRIGKNHHRAACRPSVEGLEPRTLMTVNITEIPANNGIGITNGSDGAIWFVGSNVAKNPAPAKSFIGRVDPTTHAYTEYPTPTPNSDPGAITAGPDGDLWFTEFGGKIGYIDPITHVTADFAAPVLPNASLVGITTGPDGNIWFTDFSNRMVGYVDPATHQGAEFPVPSGNLPEDIVAGPDGDLWFGEFYSGTVAQGGHAEIGYINPTTHVVTELAPPTGSQIAASLTVGPDGNLWFGEAYAGRIDEVDATSHVITEYPLPTLTDPPGSITLGPGYITVGPDGNLWFSLDVSSPYEFGAINPTTHAIVAFATTSGTYTLPEGMVTGLDGNIWATTGVNDQPGPVEIISNISVGLQPGYSQLPLTVSTHPFGSNNPDLATAEVVGLYRTILGRAPDPAGLAGWVNLLHHGASVGQVASEFLISVEYDANLVSSYYATYLGRTGSTQEVSAWVKAIQNGLTTEQVTEGFLDSTEYGVRNGMQSSFVVAVYRDFLGRMATAAEQAAGVDQIASGSVSQFVASIVNSAEANTRSIEGDYQAFLGRMVEPAALQSGLTLIQQGGSSLVAIAASVAGSAEYALRAGSSVG
jgi:streptogramin lyase